MKWVIRRDGDTREVEVNRRGNVYEVELDGVLRRVELERHDGSFASLRYPETGRSFQITSRRNGSGGWRVGVGQREFDFAVLSPAEAVEVMAGGRESGPSKLTAPIPGKVVAIKVSEGDAVKPGQPLVVLEAMKMENELGAEQAGMVAAIHVADGDTVDGGQILVEIE